MVSHEDLVHGDIMEMARRVHEASHSRQEPARWMPPDGGNEDVWWIGVDWGARDGAITVGRSRMITRRER